MKKAIRQLDPDMIISTRNYFADDINLGGLGVPIRMLACDYEVSFFHEGFLAKVNADLFKFWLPSPSPRFFKPLFARLSHLDLFKLNDDWDVLLNKIATITQVPIQEISEQFEIVGFPTRLSIHRIKELSQIDANRKKWNLQPGEHGVLVEMGMNGVGVIEEIFALLKKETHKMSIKYFFVCGRNDLLKQKFQQIIEQENLQNTSLKRSAILGLIDEYEKNELLNISSLIISKPGGSTIAEVVKVRIPLFIMHVHPQERPNREKILEDQLAYEYNSGGSLSQQVENVIQKTTSSPLQKILRPKWKKNILEKLSK